MPEQFFVEDKFDGIRAQAHKSGGRVALYSRTLDEITHRFPELTRRSRRCRPTPSSTARLCPRAATAILPFRRSAEAARAQDRRP